MSNKIRVSRDLSAATTVCELALAILLVRGRGLGTRLYKSMAYGIYVTSRERTSLELWGKP